MISDLPMSAIIAMVAFVAVGLMYYMGVFSLRKQYRNKDSFSPEGEIQKNLAEINSYQLDDSATNKFHYDNRITKDILNDGMRLDNDYIKRKKRGPYGFLSSSNKSEQDTVVVKAASVDPSVSVMVSPNQVKSGKGVAVKKEQVSQSENVTVKAGDVKSGETVIVKPSQVKPNEKVVKKSVVTGENVLVNKDEVSLDEDVMVDANQVEPTEVVIAKASQVKTGKTVVAPKESINASETVVAKVGDVNPEEPVVVDKNVIAPQAAAGIEIEAPPSVSIGSVENYKLGGDARFGKTYALNKSATKKAYATMGTRQSLAEFPLRTGVHVSRII